MTLTPVVIVPLDDMIELLDYAQPDEEKDFSIWRDENPDVDEKHHIVHAIRRLRKRTEAA